MSRSRSDLAVAELLVAIGVLLILAGGLLALSVPTPLFLIILGVVCVLINV